MTTLRLHHLETRFPGWRVEVLDCADGEVFCLDARLVLIKESYWRADPDHVEAHVSVHLAEHQDVMAQQTQLDQTWTALQEAQANAGAAEWLAQSRHG